MLIISIIDLIPVLKAKSIMGGDEIPGGMVAEDHADICRYATISAYLCLEQPGIRADIGCVSQKTAGTCASFVCDVGALEHRVSVNARAPVDGASGLVGSAYDASCRHHP